MVIEINQEKLKKKLVDVYRDYVFGREELAKEKAKKLDGLWSGSFLLSPALEDAVGALRYIYLKPFLSKKKAKEILKNLEK